MYKRLTRIDGLRGLAIFGVIAVHSTSLALSESVMPIAYLGQYGVQLFFLISGYILSYVASKDTFSTREFFFKRFFRLAPLFYIVIITCYLIGYNPPLEQGVPVKPLDLYNLLWHLSFLHGLHPDYLRSIFSVSWSLTPEVIFYFLFPNIHKFENKILWFIFLLFFIIQYFSMEIATIIFGHQGIDISIWADHSPIINMFLFIFGMLVYRLPEFFDKKIFKVLGLTFSVIFLLDGFNLLGKDFIKVFDFLFYKRHFICVMMVFPALIYSNNLIPKLLIDNKLITLLGKVSYSAFFIHYAIISILSSVHFKQNFLITVSIITVSTLIISYLSYKYIEQPFIVFGKLFDKYIKNMNIFVKTQEG